MRETRRIVSVLAVGATALAAGAAAAPEAERPETVAVGIDHAFPPYEYLDDDGQPVGFTVDLMRAIGEAMGFRVRFVAGPWHEIRTAVEEGRIDAAATMVQSDVRDRRADFSAPTLLVEYVAFVRHDSPIRHYSELSEAGGAVQRGSLFDDFLRTRPDIPHVSLETAADVLRAVSDGDQPAGVLLRAQGLYLARKMGIDNVHSLAEPLSERHLRMAVRKGRQVLLDALNGGLAAAHDNGEYDRIYDRWIGLRRDEGLLSREQTRWLYGAGIALAGFCALALLWSHTLQSQVRARTRELAEQGEQKRALERQLLQVQKTEALGRLAGGVAHDFNNLLTLILGNAQLALDEIPAESPQGGRLQRIRDAGEAGTRLTQQLLAYSRRQDVEPQRISWNTVLQESRQLLERAIGPSIALHLEPAEDLWPVRLDPGQALQVLMNLFLNAGEAMPEGGNLWIETANLNGTDGDLVRLTVRDDGPGMDPDTAARIFEPFFSARKDGKGNGLGLAIVYSIVEQGGGRISLSSQPGAGSRFDILLPRDGSEAT